MTVVRLPDGLSAGEVDRAAPTVEAATVGPGSASSSST